jgi:hypothetical protein
MTPLNFLIESNQAEGLSDLAENILAGETQAARDRTIERLRPIIKLALQNYPDNQNIDDLISELMPTGLTLD